MDTSKTTPRPPPPPPPPPQEISKKHKLPKVFLPPPPNLRRQTQPIQPVAPLKTIEAGAEKSESTNSGPNSVDLTLLPPPPPPAYPMDQQPQNEPMNEIDESYNEPIQLDENEINLIKHIRRKKINVIALCQFIQTYNFDSNNNKLEESPNPISEPVFQNVRGEANKRNQTLLHLFELQQVERKIGQAMQAAATLQTAFIRVKENLVDDMKDYIDKQIDEKLHNPVSNKRQSVLTPVESPPAKRAKSEQAFVATTEAVVREGNLQYYVKNQSSRQQHQQTTQVAGQEYQQGEWNSQQPHWPMDPRVRLRMARSMQTQSATAPNTQIHLGHSYYYGQPGQY